MSECLDESSMAAVATRLTSAFSDRVACRKSSLVSGISMVVRPVLSGTSSRTRTVSSREVRKCLARWASRQMAARRWLVIATSGCSVTTRSSTRAAIASS